MKPFVPLLLLTALLLTACGDEADFSDTTGQSDREQSPPVAVYLRRAEAGSGSLPTPHTDALDALIDQSVVTVSSPESLTERTEALQPLSIWIDAEELEMVSPVWLQSQLREGRIVVGINVSIQQLADQMRVYLRDDVRSSAWHFAEIPSFVAYYEVLYQYTNELGERSIGHSSAWRNDEFDPQKPPYTITSYILDASRVIESALLGEAPAVPTVSD